MKRLLLFSFFFACLFADLPIHCLQDQIVGTWEFSTSAQGQSPTIDCMKMSEPLPAVSKFRIEFDAKDGVFGDKGVKGRYTMVSDEGFDVVFDGMKYYAFFQYEIKNGTSISDCTRTKQGWFHELGVGPTNWGCFSAQKVTKDSRNRYSTIPLSEFDVPLSEPNWAELTSAVNSKNGRTWEAQVPSPEVLENFRASRRIPTIRQDQRPRPKPLSPEVQAALKANPNQDLTTILGLPENLDWRDKDGQDFVGPVRNQERCGSCYAYAAAGAMESAMRIATGNTRQILLSPQDTVSCNKYTQGCSGGFEILVYKQAEEFGLAELRCMAYYPFDLSKTVPCDWKCEDRSQYWYFTDYFYAGGYLGATNEEEMLKALANGPITVAIQCPPDFFTYKSGIYQHEPEPSDKWEASAHAVVLVGWGYNSTSGEKWWILKNSWARTWGIQGYMLLRRGHDDIAVESAATFIKTAAKIDQHPPQPMGKEAMTYLNFSVVFIILLVAALIMLVIMCCCYCRARGCMERKAYQQMPEDGQKA